MPSRTAIQFVFDAQQMMSICKEGHDIIITSYIEEITTQGGQLAGAMRVKAKAKPSRPDNVKRMAAMSADETIYGCPIPPCDEPDQTTA